jgi:hypothetical protein
MRDKIFILGIQSVPSKYIRKNCLGVLLHVEEDKTFYFFFTTTHTPKNQDSTMDF